MYYAIIDHGTDLKLLQITRHKSGSLVKILV